VATATATALIVDAVRMRSTPRTSGGPSPRFSLSPHRCRGVIAGTYFGRTLFGRIPEALFRRFVAALILVLGVAMLVVR